jgi:hypothetical protein
MSRGYRGGANVTFSNEADPGSRKGSRRQCDVLGANPCVQSDR